jgi:TP901 family phage tail tape measure protein
MDISDIPKSAGLVEKRFKKMEREFGKLKFKFDDKPVRNFGHGVERTTKSVKGMAAAISRAKDNVATLNKAMAKIKSGQNLGQAMREQIGTFAKQPESIQALQTLQKRTVSIQKADTPEKLKKAQMAYNEQKKETLKLLKKEAAQQEYVLSKMKGQVKAAASVTVSRREIEAQLDRERVKLELGLQKQRILWQMGKQTQRERFRYLQLINDAKARGVTITKQDLNARRQIVKEQKKMQGQGIMNMFKGRGVWFLGLRVMWELFRAIGALSEALKDLDEATGRAMRTMRSETGMTFRQVREEATKTIRQVGRISGASYKDIGEALYQLSSAGLTAEKALSGVNTVVRFATVTETSMTDAAKLLAGAMNNYGESLKSVGTETEKMAAISGTLTYVWERNQIDMNEMVQGLNQSINSAKLAGLEFSELAVIVGNLGTMMIRSGRGGRSLRSAIVQMASKGEQLAETFDFAFEGTKQLDFLTVMDKMHEGFKDLNKTADVTSKIFEIFGKRGAPAVLALLNNWEKVRGEIDGVSDAMDLMIAEHEKLMNLQERHRLVSKTLWNNIVANVAETVNYMEWYRNIMVNILHSSEAAAATTRLKKGEDVLIDSGEIRDAGQAADEYARGMAKVNKILQSMSEEKESPYGEGSPLEGELKIWEDYVVMMSHVMKKLREKEKTDKAAVTNVQMLSEAEKAHIDKLETKRQVLVRLGALDKVRTAGEIKDALAEEREELVRINKEWDKARATYRDNSELMEEYNKKLVKQTKIVLKLQDAYNQLYEQNKVLWKEAELRTKGFKDPQTSGQGKGKIVGQRRAAGITEVGGFEGESPAMQAVKNAQAQRDLNQEVAVSAQKWAELNNIRNMGHEETMDHNLTLIQQERQKQELQLEALRIEALQYEEEQKKIDVMDIGDEQTNAQEALDAKVSANSLAQESMRGELDITKMKEEELANWREKSHGRFLSAIGEQGAAWTLQGAIVKAYGQNVADALGQGLENLKFVLAEAGKESKAAWDAYKAIAIVQTLVKTYEGAQGAFTAVSWIPIIGPFLGIALAAAAITAGIARVNAIRSAKPASKAKGGVFDGTFVPDGGESYAMGGVTSGVARGIIGDNPSGRELVIPSEAIKRDSTAGYVRDQGGGGAPINIINAVTQDDISQSMAESESGQNVIVNTIGQDMNARKSTFKQVQEIQQGKTPGNE